MSVLTEVLRVAGPQQAQRAASPRASFSPPPPQQLPVVVASLLSSSIISSGAGSLRRSAAPRPSGMTQERSQQLKCVLAHPALDPSTPALDLHEAGLAELLQVVGDRRGCQSKILSQVTGAAARLRLIHGTTATRAAVSRKLEENPQSLGIGERPKRRRQPIEIIRSTFRHVSNYTGGGGHGQGRGRPRTPTAPMPGRSSDQSARAGHDAAPPARERKPRATRRPVARSSPGGVFPIPRPPGGIQLRQGKYRT